MTKARKTWTVAELPEHLRKQAETQLKNAPDVTGVAARKGQSGFNSRLAHPSPARHVTGRMNEAEARFARHLVRIGLPYRFEAVRLRLADGCTYTPDFYLPKSRQFAEVKAWWKGAGKVGWKDDARVKWKLAGELYPEFEFCAVWWRADLGRFDYEWAHGADNHSPL